MRYTAEATMEQQGLHDVERWKDKIEVRLDNRQVAFLFFGSALVACLLFILGVIVGKRLESRGRAMAPEIEDPLALLDRVATTPARVEAAPVLAAVALPSVPQKPVARVAPEAAPARVVAEKAAPVAAAVPAAEKVTPPEKPAPAAEKSAAAAAASTERAGPKIVTVVAPGAEAARAASEAKKANKSRYSLQIGSFSDRAEADAFSHNYASEKPWVVLSDVPGKGTWFRVRIGEFLSFKEAVDAKMGFERRYNKIALVIGPL